MSVKTQVSVQFSHLVVSDSASPWTPGFPVHHQLLKLLFKPKHKNHLGFPDSSVGKESTRNAGDPSWIPGLGRSTGDGIGYPFQYSWASLLVQW